MAEERAQRRLAAIFAVDVAGYSRLMEADEERTLRAFRACQAALVRSIADHGGRIFGGAGDSLMADRDDLFVDGVNVAARLQTLAEPGGICISGSIHEHVENKLRLPCDDLGMLEVKNIARPVRVLRVQLRAPSAAPPNAVPPLAVKPAVAVLPFDNMSGDPEQEYFSDGITEDIITDLSKVSTLNVLSRNTTFTLKGKAVDVGQIGQRLKVGYVVEGSVRKAGGRVRITAQLIDAAKDSHVWGERYDRELTDIFALQDEIAQAIVTALKVRLLPGEKKAIESRSTQSPEAYQLYLLARYYQMQYGVRTLKI